MKIIMYSAIQVLMLVAFTFILINYETGYLFLFSSFLFIGLTSSLLFSYFFGNDEPKV